MKNDLTIGSVPKSMLKFSLPMILGNLMQQIYNISDTLIVGHFIGTNALAGVGACYALIIFLTSILLGLCMGSGALFSIFYGEKNFDIFNLAYTYLYIIFIGFSFSFIYNYFTCLLRALGNSKTPLIFFTISAILNIILSIILVAISHMGVAGSAIGTIIAQAFCAIGLVIYTLKKCPELIPERKHFKFNLSILKDIANSSLLTCLQQSVMNFGILLVQGLVNSFGATVMAAFTIAVKIDSLAYMPAQDFGNAFSTFIGQNFGAKKPDRIIQGIQSAFIISFLFCLIISYVIFIFAPQLMTIFVDNSETKIIQIGVDYLRIEGSFYFGIGILFLLYGFYRAIKFPMMSVILTIISLGTRVGLAYYLATIPEIGVLGIWWSIPIGWILADIFGIFYYKYHRSKFNFNNI